MNYAMPGFLPVGISRFQAFLAIQSVLTDKQYWKTLRDAYVSSDDLNKNYEKSDDNSISKHLKNIDNQDNDSVKHIKIPKMKQSQYYYNKPKINELEEYFFNE